MTNAISKSAALLVAAHLLLPTNAKAKPPVATITTLDAYPASYNNKKHALDAWKIDEDTKDVYGDGRVVDQGGFSGYCIGKDAENAKGLGPNILASGGTNGASCGIGGGLAGSLGHNPPPLVLAKNCKVQIKFTDDLKKNSLTVEGKGSCDGLGEKSVSYVGPYNHDVGYVLQVYLNHIELHKQKAPLSQEFPSHPTAYKATTSTNALTLGMK